MKSIRHITRGVLVALVMTLAVGSGAPSAGQSQTVPAHGNIAAKKRKLTGVANFGEVTPTLYRGAQPSRQGFESLAKLGIDIVVDVRLTGKGAEKKTVNGLGMEYVSIPWHCWFPRDKPMRQVLELLRNNPKKKVFVHCRYGDDRTGMMIAAYRMAVDKWTPGHARPEINQLEFKRNVSYHAPAHPRSECGTPARSG